MKKDPAALTEKERRRIVVGVLIGMFLAALDQTIVTPAMPTIGASLGDTLWLSWIVSAYFLTSTAVTPLSGKIADLRGRRPVLYTSIAIFLIGSVICAVAPSMPILVGGRAIQGLGGGGLLAAIQTIIGDVAPPKIRARYTIYVTTLWAVSSVGGPIVGGLLTQHVHWSMIFWINLPVGAIAWICSARALRMLPDVRRDHKLDWRGAMTVTIATVSFLLALTMGGTTFPWLSPVILSLLLLSVLFFLTFVWSQFRTEEPLLPPRILGNPVVAHACTASSLATACQIGLSVYLPIYLQLVEGFDAASSGAALVALLGGGVVGSNLSGSFMHRYERYKRIAIFGGAASSTALVLLGLFAGRMSFVWAEILVGIAGFGFGTLFPMALISVQNASDPRDLGIATATIGFLRSLGSVIGLAILSAVAAAEGIVGHIGAETAQLTSSVQASVGQGFRAVFLTIAALEILSLIFTLKMEEKPLRSHHG